MIEERGVSLAHISIMRGVHPYRLECNEWIRTYLKSTSDSTLQESLVDFKFNYFPNKDNHDLNMIKNVYTEKN